MELPYARLVDELADHDHAVLIIGSLYLLQIRFFVEINAFQSNLRNSDLGIGLFDKIAGRVESPWKLLK